MVVDRLIAAAQAARATAPVAVETPYGNYAGKSFEQVLIPIGEILSYYRYVDPAKTFAAALALDDLAEAPDAAKGVIKLVEGLTKFNFHLADHGLGVQTTLLDAIDYLGQEGWDAHRRLLTPMLGNMLSLEVKAMTQISITNSSTPRSEIPSTKVPIKLYDVEALTESRWAKARRINLKRWMKDNEVKGIELARRLGVGPAYVSLLFRPDRYFGEKAARSIEDKLNLPCGYLDASADASLAAETWEHPSEISNGQYGLVSQSRLSVAHGQVSVKPIDLPAIAFKREWLLDSGVTDRRLLTFGEHDGDSMAPYLSHSSLFLVDGGQKEVHGGSIYAIVYGEELRVRRLHRRFDDGLILHADNASYPREELNPNEVARIIILGRVLWRAG